MDASVSRSSIAKQKDPHDWNTFRHYQAIHETRLATHPFVDHKKQSTLEFDFIEFPGSSSPSYVRLYGDVFCKRNIVLEVDKYFETQTRGKNVRIKGFSYLYVAHVSSGNLILKYHNHHDSLDEYHHRIYNFRTGEEIDHEVLNRHQFPSMTEVIDEIESLTRRYHTTG